MSIDDSACNLASLNLMKFLHDDGEFDIEASSTPSMSCSGAGDHRRLLVVPDARDHRNALAFRQLGLGYANLGALLMAAGWRTTRTRVARMPRRSPRS